MPIVERVAILLDGEFVKKTLKGTLKRPPVRGDVMTEVDRIMTHKSLAGYSLYRVLYYTAEPLVGVIRHPLTGVATDFGATAAYSESRQLIDTIEQAPDVAVRRGVLLHQG